MPILVPFIIAGCARSAPPAVPAEPEIPPVFDHAIIPGKRVGPISLGMSAVAVSRAIGAATSSADRDSVIEYRYPDFAVMIGNTSQRVASIRVTSGQYALLSGLSVGMSESATIEQLGAPCNADPPPGRGPRTWPYEFRGVTVVIDEFGVVASIEVNSSKEC